MHVIWILVCHKVAWNNPRYILHEHTLQIRHQKVNKECSTSLTIANSVFHWTSAKYCIIILHFITFLSLGCSDTFHFRINNGICSDKIICLQLSWFFISFLSPAVFLMNSKNLWVKIFLWISLKTTWQWNSPASNMLQKSLTVFVLADRRKIPSTSKPASHKTKSWAHALILYRMWQQFQMLSSRLLLI